MNKKDLKFNIDVLSKYRDDEDQDFSIVRIQALSDGYNTHEIEIPNDVLKRDAQTVLGKPIVAKLDRNYFGVEDFKGHETDEIVIGYVPPNSEVRFPNEENGTFFEVDAVLFKLYSGNALDIFKRDGKKSVSCEFTYSYLEDNPKKADSFIIRGITILGSDDLGNPINPSCVGANAEVIKFSEKYAEEVYAKYAEKEFKNNENEKDKTETNEMSKILSKLESIEETIEKFREEKMAENKDKNLENKEEMSENETKDTSKEEMAQKEDTSKKDDVKDEPEDEKMACEDKAKMSQEIEELKIELSKKETVIASQLSELKELREFKAEYQKNEKNSIVTATLSKVKEYVDTETFEKFKASAESCKFEDINGWKNEVLASITEKVLMSEKHEDGIMDMGLPSYTERKTSIYD